MIDPVTFSLWRGRLGYVFLVALILLASLIPFGGEAGQLPGPDLLLCLTFAWMMRKPDFLPLWLLILVFLTADILTQKPIGLWAALAIVATEILRAREVLMRELSFLMELVVVAGLMLGMILIYRFVFALTLLPQVGFGFALVQWLWSVLAYPVVVWLNRYILDLRKPGLGEIDAFGRRL
jgi:rod shape-determining protein MreD